MTDYNIETLDWFTERCIYFKPKHFIITNIPATSESIEWIYKALRGRFCLTNNSVVHNLELYSSKTLFPAFEDPAEATAYELTWG